MATLQKWIFFLLMAKLIPAEKIRDIERARQWLEEYDRLAEAAYYQEAVANWIYNTNITDYNEVKATESTVQRSLFTKEAAKNASLFDWRSFNDTMVRRQFEKISVQGTAALPEDEIEKLQTLTNKMETIYSTGEVCKDGNCFNLEPDLARLLTTSRDWDTLVWVWQGWRNVTGRKIKYDYEKFVALQNKASRLDGFADTGAYWRSWYEMDNFESELERLWNTVKPLYQQLHAFVRKKLQKAYAGKPFPKEGHIPAHILGNMWAQSWNVQNLTMPYPDAASIDVTPALVEQGYNATAIIRLSEEFFTSIGLSPMPKEFWENSMFERPADGRQVVCHASAWDFSNRKDFRIKQCTDITFEWVVTTHHEMGHIQYFIQYQNLTNVFRDGANDGFHEAVGDVMALSVSTPEHLHEIGLLDRVDENREADLNYLMSQALDKVAFLPFGFLIDQWRWSVFRGDVKVEEYNKEWWKLRCKYQGVYPPVPRSKDDFDPGAKYHIPANTPYIRYFLSYILQFQFHKALCNIANSTRPLHRCDIYKSKEAGTALGNMLKLGSSVPWQQALKQVTGIEKMDAQPLLDYFKPLYDWLVVQNNGEKIGWNEQCPDGTFVTENKEDTENNAVIATSSCITLTLLILTFAILFRV